MVLFFNNINENFKPGSFLDCKNNTDMLKYVETAKTENLCVCNYEPTPSHCTYPPIP